MNKKWNEAQLQPWDASMWMCWYFIIVPFLREQLILRPWQAPLPSRLNSNLEDTVGEGFFSPETLNHVFDCQLDMTTGYLIDFPNLICLTWSVLILLYPYQWHDTYPPAELQEPERYSWCLQDAIPHTQSNRKSNWLHLQGVSVDCLYLPPPSSSRAPSPGSSSFHT